MQIERLHEVTDKAQFGGKAVNLGVLSRQGILIPDGIVISSDILVAWIESLFRHEREMLDTPGKLKKYLTNKPLPDILLEEIFPHLDMEKEYAVRSSAQNEDSGESSFAGIYLSKLHVSGKDALAAAIKEVLLASIDTVVAQYQGRDINDMPIGSMAVIIQEMIEGEKSGVAFSVHPQTGEDSEILIETIAGTCQLLVDGKVTPEQIIYDWQCENFLKKNDVSILTETQIATLVDILLTLQRVQGHPVDIEYTFIGETCYLLQMRPITAIKFAQTKQEWTNANFKDGGVSSAICAPFMYSLYEMNWQVAMQGYFATIHAKHDKTPNSYLRYQFGKVYWNLTVVKEVMEQIPGYVERDFDNELGITITYEGEGEKSKFTPTMLARLPRLALGHIQLRNQRVKVVKKMCQDFKVELTALFQQKSVPVAELLETWRYIVQDLYPRVEQAYFTQVFINTVELSLFKDTMLKYISTPEMYSLLSHLADVSHTRPISALWQLKTEHMSPRLVTTLQAFDYESFKHWLIAGDDVTPEFATEQELIATRFMQILETYGYHSLQELDVRVPAFSEAPETFVKLFYDVLQTDNTKHPDVLMQQTRSKQQVVLQNLATHVSKGKFRKLTEKVTAMRQLLWWREELKDCSTHCYAVVRKITVELADYFVKIGLLEQQADIWFLSQDEIVALLERLEEDGATATVVTELAEIVTPELTKRAIYVESFRNYSAPNDFGSHHTFAKKPKGSRQLTGVGCSQGVISGKVRIVDDYADLDKLQPDDIIVTKYTDTGWLSKFASIHGLITEHGGILCHAAVVAREFNLPIIVAVTGATTLLKEGETIMMNAATGEIFITEEH